MGYWEEKQKYDSLKSSPQVVNRCPKCKKGFLISTVGFGVFTHKHIFKSFCPVCGYTIKRKI